MLPSVCLRWYRKSGLRHDSYSLVEFKTLLDVHVFKGTVEGVLLLLKARGT